MGPSAPCGDETSGVATADAGKRVPQTTDPIAEATIAAMSVQGRFQSEPCDRGASGSGTANEQPQQPRRETRKRTSIAAHAIEGERGATVVLQEADGIGKTSSVRVSGCTNSCIYVLAPTRFVSMENCNACTIVLGPVATLVVSEECVGMRVMAVCNRIHIDSNASSIFFLACAEGPVLCGSNDGVYVAPYNTFYETLGAHIEDAGLAIHTNSWNRVYHKQKNSEDDERVPTAIEPTLSVVPCSTGEHILPPERFEYFVVPFVLYPSRDQGRGHATMSAAQVGRVTRWNPFPPPPAYAVVLDSQRDSVFQLRMAIFNAGLDDCTNAEVQRMIHARFGRWLGTSGWTKHIEALERMRLNEATSAD